MLPPKPFSYLSTSVHPHCHFSRPGYHHLMLYLLQQPIPLPSFNTSPATAARKCLLELNLIMRFPSFILCCLETETRFLTWLVWPCLSHQPHPFFTTSLQFFPFKNMLWFLMPGGLCLQHALPCYPPHFGYSYSPQGPIWDSASSRTPSLSSQTSLGAHVSPLRAHSCTCLLHCAVL